MTVNHDAVAALPITGSASKTLVRNVFVARMPYVLADAEDSRNLVATDPSTGAVIVDMLLLGRVFHYDPTDTTTAHDGTSCLVSVDGLRYKLAVGTDVFAYAVINNTTSVPPGSPTLGDAYLVAAGATGAWAGKSNYIAVKTNRGWEFVNFSIGRFIYVESVDTYYHKNAGGAWVTGFGNQVTTANSVPLSAAINFGKRLIVENQTTTAPPGSPTVGTAYIIGPSATGGWSGFDGRIAICEVAGSFVVYTATNGWAAYDKAQSNEFHFDGTTWISSAGAILGFTSSFSATGAFVTDVGANYSYSTTTAPIRGQNAFRDTPCAISYAARKTGALLRLTYHFFPNGGWMSACVFLDAVSNAIAWDGGQTSGVYSHATLIAIVTTSDALSHTYTPAFQGLAAGGGSSASRRTFTIEEFA